MIAIPLLLCLAQDATPMEHAGPITSLAWSEGQLVACSQAGLSVRDGLDGEDRRLASLTFRPVAVAPLRRKQARWVVVGGSPAESGTIALLDLEGQVLVERRLADDVLEAVAAQGASVAVGAADGRVWWIGEQELEPRLLHQHEGPVQALVFHDQGRGLSSVSDDGWVQRSSTRESVEAKSLGDHTAGVVSITQGPALVSASAPGGWTWSGSRDGVVRVHDPAGRLRRSYLRLGAEVWALASDGTRVYAGLADGRVLELAREDASTRTCLECDTPVHALLAVGEVGSKRLVVATGGIHVLDPSTRR